MKKCPTCEKTFEDSMRFCQSDGTQLVMVEEVIDPYKTMVARPEEIAAAIPPKTPAAEPPKPVETVQDDGDVLQIPKADVNKTMFVSEEEIRREMASDLKAEEPVMEIPPAKETPAPPAFIDADLNPVSVPPPSPIAATPEPANSSTSEPRVSNLTTPPIPSPFGSSPKSSAADVSPMVPQFKVEPKPEPPPAGVPSFDEVPATPSSPFDSPGGSFDDQAFQPSASTPPNQAMAQAEWTPPPVPESNWQEPASGNPPPPPAAGAGQSKTLAIVSLIVGILSLCCGYLFLPGLAAIVTGFMARGKASKDPANYGGGGLALGGIICGGISLVLGVVVIIMYLLGFAAMLTNR